jgi:hypothetical protein
MITKEQYEDLKYIVEITNERGIKGCKLLKVLKIEPILGGEMFRLLVKGMYIQKNQDRRISKWDTVIFVKPDDADIISLTEAQYNSLQAKLEDIKAAFDVNLEQFLTDIYDTTNSNRIYV